MFAAIGGYPRTFGVILLLALISGACTSTGREPVEIDADPSPTTTEQASITVVDRTEVVERKEAFVVSANSRCAQLESDLSRLDTQASPAVGGTSAELTSLVTDAVVDLRALTPPLGQEASFEDAFTQLQYLAVLNGSPSGETGAAAEPNPELVSIAETLTQTLSSEGLVACVAAIRFLTD